MLEEPFETPYSRCDPWKGWQPIYVEAFRTKRLGRVQIRYRIRSGDWAHFQTYVNSGNALRCIAAMARSRVDFKVREDA